MRRDRIDSEFLAYVTAYQGSLRHTAYLMCGDRHLAEDAVQTALIKVYLRWGRIDRDNAVHSYARRAVVRAVLDELRRPWRRTETPGEIPDPAEAADRLSTVDDRLLLRTALAELPPRQRATVILRFVDDLDVQQTAAVMGCRPSTVANATAHALTSLRTFLIRHGVVRGTRTTIERTGGTS